MQLFRKRAKTVWIREDHKKLSYQVANLQMIGERNLQEDSFALVNGLDVTEIIKYGLFAIVADGMGGMNDGKKVSELAISEFVSAFKSMDRKEDIPSQLFDSVHGTNKILYEKFHGDGGTTVVLVMIYNEVAYWASVGDSSIYLKRNGGLFKLNCDHTYENILYLEELSKEEISKEEVEKNEDKVRLSEFLGKDDIDAVDYNIKPLKLKDGDVILVCSDGISSYLDEEAISAALEYTPNQACIVLNNLIMQQAYTKQDNYTALIVAVNN